MPKTIELINGKKVSIRAKCLIKNCGLLLVGENGDGTKNSKEKTIKLNHVKNTNDLKGIPGVICVHCR